MKSNVNGLLTRVQHLQRQHGLIPRFTATFDDGHTAVYYGAEIIRYGRDHGVNRVLFDDENQAAVDQIALYQMLHTDVIVEPKTK